MKRDTSIKNALEVARRVRQWNGIIGCPLHNVDFIVIKRVWLFGSTVKGKPYPNDTDILVEWTEVPLPQRVGDRTRHSMRGSFIPEKGDWFWKGWPKQAKYEVFKMLRRGMKMVRIHDYELDGKLAHPRIMLYPRNDLLPHARPHFDEVKTMATPPNSKPKRR